jgi:predicted nucleic acid-binding protein
MQGVIIADTSCLILLHKIGEFSLLQKLFGQITITSEIEKEFGLKLPEWVIIKNSSNQNYKNIIKASVDTGEASAIALALEEPGSLLILDDLKARKLAASLNLQYTGTLGILVEGKLSGHLNSIKPLIAKIRLTNFHLPDALEQKILQAAGENNEL